MYMCLCRVRIIVFYIFHLKIHMFYSWHIDLIYAQRFFFFERLLSNVRNSVLYYNFFIFTFGCVVCTWSFHSFDEIPVCHFAGDPRRPYPTDFEMRLGFLGKVGDLPLNTPVLQSQGSYGEPMSSNRNTAQTGQSLL